MIDKNDLVAVGKFHKTHALKGELNAVLDIDPEYAEEGNPLVLELDGIFVPFYTTEIRPKGTTSWLVKLDGVNTEEEARGLVNHRIYAIKEQLKDFMDVEGDFYGVGEFDGYELHDTVTGRTVGKVKRIDDSTANLLFVIETEDGDEIYVPVAEEWIEEIDEGSRVVTMAVPQGILELNNKK